MKWLVFVLIGFTVSLIYLFEYSTTVKLTFESHSQESLLMEISKRVELLRIKEVMLSSAQRIYKLKDER